VSVRLRIVLAFVALAGVGLAMLLRWVVIDFRTLPPRASEEAMVDMANVLAALVESQLDGDGRIDTTTLRAALDGALARRFEARIFDLTKGEVSLRVYVTDASGRVLYDSDGGRAEGQDYSRWIDVSRTLAGGYGARATRADARDPFSSVLHVAAPIRRGERTVGVLTVAKPVASVAVFIRTASRRLALAGALTLVLTALLSLGLARWLTLPIERLTAYARSIRAGGRPALPRLAPREIRALGEALEEMRLALEGKRYVEGYVRTLTHEIKGPLSAIRAAGELLAEDLPASERRRFLDNIQSECARLQLMVDRMLALSAVEARQGLETPASIEVAALVREVVASATPLAEQRGIRLEAPLPGEEITLRGDTFLVRQALFNLVQNALDFTLAGGLVTVTAKAGSREVDLIVRDTGLGIPEYALPRVFERFYSARPPDAPVGVGLGLAFVRQVAILHGGDAALANRPEGGAVATLRLPLSTPCAGA
jgi:two-component system sensor histidine kinase CreC